MSAGVLGVALDEPVARMVVVRLREPAVLREVVEPDDLVAGLEQLRDEVAVDEPGRAGDEDLHRWMPCAERAPDVDDVLAADLEAAVRLVRRAEDEDVALAEDAVEGRRGGRRVTYGSVQTTRAPAHARSFRSL